MGGRAEIFQLLAGEDVDGDEMDLCVAVLAGLGGGHFDNLARTVLDDDEAVLPQGRALHGEGLRGPRAGLVDWGAKNISHFPASTSRSWDAPARRCAGAARRQTLLEYKFFNV